MQKNEENEQNKILQFVKKLQSEYKATEVDQDEEEMLFLIILICFSFEIIFREITVLLLLRESGIELSWILSCSISSFNDLIESNFFSRSS